MKYKGINPNGKVLEYKRVTSTEEIALIQHPDTGTLLWRHKVDSDEKFEIDYNYEIVDDIWEFEAFLKEEGLIV